MSTLTVKCPMCQRPVVWQENQSRPFCSERCRLMDLGCWVDESYRLPVQEESMPSDLELMAGDE